MKEDIDLEKFGVLLKNESDRGVVLISAELIYNYLTKLFQKRLLLNRKLKKDILAKKAFLFAPGTAKIPRWRWWRWAGGQDASFHYYLKAAAKVKLFIKDSSGKVVKELKAGGDAEYNVAAWDLSKKADKKAQRGRRQSPYVTPGKYTVVLKVGSVSVEETIEVKK